jgi:GNAT superfamily N-acetyltransferase
MTTLSIAVHPVLETMINNTLYSVRRAMLTDIPFLAWMQYEASLPPAYFSFWDFPIMGMNIEGKAFIETVLKLNAGAWGSVDEFWILEENGQPIAAAAGIEAGIAFAEGPVRMQCLETIGQTLGWTSDMVALFRERYRTIWTYPVENPLLLPQAPWIIESVAVVPQARGKGLINVLMHSLIAEGRERGHASVGITVANGNEAARRVYERLGFKMYMAFGPAFFEQEGVMGYTKYKMSLG